MYISSLLLINIKCLTNFHESLLFRQFNLFVISTHDWSITFRFIFSFLFKTPKLVCGHTNASSVYFIFRLYLVFTTSAFFSLNASDWQLSHLLACVHLAYQNKSQCNSFKCKCSSPIYQKFLNTNYITALQPVCICSLFCLVYTGFWIKKV